jgi:hypothetical protein
MFLFAGKFGLVAVTDNPPSLTRMEEIEGGDGSGLTYEI